ncbi:MAG: TadE/TadG family type IV pilus assembly protein [Gaiellaceae bacterium]
MRRLLHRRTPATRDERGAVMVLVAVTLPVIILFVAFGVEVGHWFDYSRNLQNRADAAALAAGLEYGNTCAASTPDPAAMAKIGAAAQRYSGPGSTSDLPYPYSTWPAGQYTNIPNLQAGTLAHYHLVINGAGAWQPGQTSNGQWPGHSGTTASFTNGTVCAASYPDDQGGATGPITDVWVTQDHLPLFFSLFGFNPTISAHARVELQQGIGSDNVSPIAVRDEANPGCVTVNFLTDDASHTLIKTMTLTQQTSTLWSNPSGDTLPMTASNVIVQPVLGCGADAVTYDGSTNSGLNYINSYSAASPGSGQGPALTTGGVTLGGCAGAPDQYFSNQACSASVTAHVAFAPGIPYGNETVTAFDTGANNTVTLSKLHTNVNGNQNNIPAGGLLRVDSTAGFTPTGSITNNSTNPVPTSFAYSAIADATHFRLTNGGSFGNNDVITQTGDTSWTSGVSGLPIGVQSGQHPIRIDWKQTSGSIGGNSCGNGGNACNGNFGIQQQAFGACNACDPPDDSDGIVGLQLRLASDPVGTYGENAFSSTATPNLVVSLTLTTLRFDTPSPASPDIILRVGTSTDQATGLIDCGQGNGANADSNAVTFGCPWYTSSACNNYDFCAPLIDYDASKHPLGTCDPELRATADPTYSDCVHTISGTRRSKIPLGIANRIITNGVCSPNHWIAYATNPAVYPLKDDPRAVLFIITKPADLSKNSVVPIETFATFYITGWDTSGSLPNCSPPAGQPGNDPWPGTGKSKQNGAIWGHWITYSSPQIITKQQFCDPTLFGVCGTVLTR